MKTIVFDFDKTLTIKDSFYPFLVFANQDGWFIKSLKKALFFICRVLFQLRIISNFILKDLGIKIFLRNYSKDVVRQAGEDFFRRIPFHDNIVKELQICLNQDNTQVFISSSSLNEYIAPILQSYPTLRIYTSNLKYVDNQVIGLGLNNFRDQKRVPFENQKIDVLFTDLLEDLPLVEIAQRTNIVRADGQISTCSGANEFRALMAKNYNASDKPPSQSHPDARKKEYEKLEPRHIPKNYYDFAFYIDRERILTYWYQIKEILALNPAKILEVGVGNKIVSSVLANYGIKTITADINESLGPDKVVSATRLDTAFGPGEFPLVLCARVLHHLPFSEFDTALSQLCYVTQEYLLLTLPFDTLQFYINFRITGSTSLPISIPFPLVLKRILQRLLKMTEISGPQRYWKINSRKETHLSHIQKIINKYFFIVKYYRVPEAKSHAFFILRKK